MPPAEHTDNTLTNILIRVASVEVKLEERHGLYMSIFEEISKSSETRFLSQEKAIEKSEKAQNEYNIRSNEFRGQLDDQAKTLMPRTESTGRWQSLSEKVDALRVELVERIDRTARIGTENKELLGKEIAGLRESRSAGEGTNKGASLTIAYIFSAASFITGLIGIGLALTR